MRDLVKFAKSTGVYLIGNVMTKAVTFFMLPLYTKYLNPSDYGTYDLHIAYITFLSSILFLDIWSGIMRFMFDYTDEKDKAKPVVIGVYIFTISTILYLVLVIVLGAIMHIPYKGWLFLYGLTTNMSQLVGYVARAEGKNHIYVIGGLVGTIINVVLSIIFIAALHCGYQYLYIAYCIGMLVNVLFVGYGIRFYRLLDIHYFDKALFSSMLRFALPLCPNSAAYWFLTSYNKVVINISLSVTQNGLYAVANKFSTVMQLITQCFQMAWQELTFSKAGNSKEEMDQFYTKAVNEFIRFLSIGTMMVIPFIKIIFPMMVDHSYYEAEYIVPFAILATLLSCVSAFLGSIISTLKVNKIIFTTTVFGSIVNVVLVNILIGRIGVQAASIALAAGFMITVIRRLVLLGKYLAIKLDLKMIIIVTIGIAISCAVYIECSIAINAAEIIPICFYAAFSYRDMINVFRLRIVKKIY